MKLYLASKSPRRKELLSQMGIEFEVLPLDIAEEPSPHEEIQAYSRRITHEKLCAGWDKVIMDKLPLMPILCADTEVVIDQRILGKPSTYEEAFAMIKSYCGRSHQVITTIGLKYADFEKMATNITHIEFAAIPDMEIHKYLSSGDYIDKSGGYGIQSYIGQYIRNINGCFYSVMGLPLNMVRELYDELKNKLAMKKHE